VTQGVRVVIPEALDMVRLEPGTLECNLYARQMQRRAVGEHVALCERTRLRLSDAQARDPVVENAAAGAHEVDELARVSVDLARADVLHHADAPDRVEGPVVDGAVVLDPDFDPVGQAAFRDPLARELGLRLRECDADDADAVVLGGVDGEAAPAAADVEHALTLVQVELGADQLELLSLCLLERLRAAREDRAAVRHRLVEEEGEELVRDVVVVTHRANIALDRVSAAAEAELRLRHARETPDAESAGRGQRQPYPLAPLQLGRPPARHDLERAIEVVHLDSSRHVRAPEPELAG